MGCRLWGRTESDTTEVISSTMHRLELATGQLLMLRSVLSTKKKLAKTPSQPRPWGFVVTGVPIKGVLAQRVKHLPAMQKTQLRSLGRALGPGRWKTVPERTALLSLQWLVGMVPLLLGRGSP